MSGRYCEKHNEWAPTGECRWCEPLCAWEEIPIWTGEMPMKADELGPYTPVNPLVGRTADELQRMMNELWVRLVREDKKS